MDKRPRTEKLKRQEITLTENYKNKSVQILKLESLGQPMVIEDLMILACTVFAWSTRVTDRQTDGQTELRWLRRAIAVPAVARKNWNRKKAVMQSGYPWNQSEEVPDVYGG